MSLMSETRGILFPLDLTMKGATYHGKLGSILFLRLGEIPQEKGVLTLMLFGMTIT